MFFCLFCFFFCFFLPNLDNSCFVSAQDLSYHFFLTVLVLLFFLYFRTGKVCLVTSMTEFVNLLTALFTPDSFFLEIYFQDTSEGHFRLV